MDITDRRTAPEPDLRELPTQTKVFFITLLLIFAAIMLWVTIRGIDPTAQSPFPINNPPLPAPTPPS